eukprot:4769354-Pyramimonas_sp.AAC.1
MRELANGPEYTVASERPAPLQEKHLAEEARRAVRGAGEARRTTGDMGSYGDASSRGSERAISRRGCRCYTAGRDEPTRRG